MRPLVDSNTITYAPSVVGRTARFVLPVLHKLLPPRGYAAVYEIAYNSYKRLLHFKHWLAVTSRRPFASEKRKLRDDLSLALLPHTMGGRKALENAFDVVARVEAGGIPGALVECGVAEGGTAAMMAMTSKALGGSARDVWLFDSYEGLPEPTVEDYHDGRAGEFIRPLPKGACLGTIEQVSELFFGKLGFPRDQVHLVKGWFQDTVPLNRGKVPQIAVLRLDGDWYESTRIPLENFYDQVSPGGFVIIDDYATCFGSRRAVDEFRVERGISTRLHEDGRGGVYFQKDW
jgi:hypothetical protein